MVPQELWHWVHNCYGDELGLTSSDDDYVQPPNIGEAKDSLSKDVSLISKVIMRHRKHIKIMEFWSLKHGNYSLKNTVTCHMQDMTEFLGVYLAKWLRLLTSNHLSYTAVSLNPGRLWILLCEKAIQLTYGTSLVLLGCLCVS
jgi:hypothetical protein